MYRKVRLIKKSKVHIAQWGVQITTPEVSEEKATIKINTKINNETNSTGKLALKYSVLDTQGKEVASKKVDLENNASSAEIEVVNPYRNRSCKPTIMVNRRSKSISTKSVFITRCQNVLGLERLILMRIMVFH